MPAANASSDNWRPYILRSCPRPGSSALTRRMAPCLAAEHPQHIAHAEELVYPDFKIRLPSFLRPEHEALWARLWEQFGAEEHERCLVDRGWGHYRGAHGQNLVLQDVVVPGDVSTSLGWWKPDGCASPPPRWR